MRGEDGVSRFDIIIGMKSCIFPIAVLAAVLAQGALANIRRLAEKSQTPL